MNGLGVVIVTHNSQEHIIGCLESLYHTREQTHLSVIVVDNGSLDLTLELIENWVSQNLGHGFSNGFKLSLHKNENQGFAAGVNLGLMELLPEDKIDRYWIVNPDTYVAKGTIDALANYDRPFDILGSRIAYLDRKDIIQLDGGKINRWTGVAKSINIGSSIAKTPLPDATELDYISGASMVVTREFVESVGMMAEEYFLYYEEIDWVFRSNLKPKLRLCPEALVYHAAGASIGSPTLDRAASETSVFFKHNSRLAFMRQFYPTRMWTAYLFGLAKGIQHLTRGQWVQAKTVFAVHLENLLSASQTGNIAGSNR